MIQERNNYCLCAVIQSIFSSDGVFISQDNIAKNLTCTNEGFKADDKKIKNLMRENGFNYKFYWWNETPFNEPDSLIKEISENDGFIGLGDHTYRVLEFEDPIVLVLDPRNEYTKQYDYYLLMKKLSKLGGGFGLIKKLK